ncbi:MAG: hypothetical protein WC792_04690 [Candidatus Micrarchaeia archaeon]|jgi:hypothetical protein
MPQRKRPAEEVHVNFTHGHSVQLGESKEQTARVPPKLKMVIDALRKLKTPANVRYSNKPGQKETLIVELLKRAKAKK